MTDDTQPIHPAASVILLREAASGVQILMGQRGSKATFMPNKYVFPGGRVDQTDAQVRLDPELSPRDLYRLNQESDTTPTALAAAAIRELWEEAGLRLGTHSPASPGTIPPGWEGFLDKGLAPNAAALRFMFRAVTPPGRPRRFDARFFLADTASIIGDSDDFSAADDELGQLHWLPLSEARALDLPFITRVVLSEVATCLTDPPGTRPVPFFDHSLPQSRFRMIADAEAA